MYKIPQINITDVTVTIYKTN